MFKHILSSSALVLTFGCGYMQAEVVDLGTMAATYPIEEKSFKVSIQEGISDLNRTQLNNELMQSFELLAQGKSDIPVSQAEESYIAKNVYSAPYDIKDIDGQIKYRKGENLSPRLPLGQEIELCFIDARNLEVVPLIAEKFGKCIYFTANNNIKNVFPYIKAYSADGRIYPMNERYTRRFNITRFPTKIRLFDDKIEYTILNHKKLVKEASRRKL